MQRAKYWSCSRFANWARGTPKPNSGTMEEWRAWRKSAKARHPYRYWLAEKGLTKLQDFVNWPSDKIHAIRIWWHNGFIAKTHVCKTGLKFGRWHEPDYRMFHGMFGVLVDFVECEKAHEEYSWCREEYLELESWWNRPPLIGAWMEFRYPHLGITRLQKEASYLLDDEYFGWYNEPMPVAERPENWGKPTEQAVHAKEVLELYLWWTRVRPNRQDPYKTESLKNLPPLDKDEDIFDRHDKLPKGIFDETHKLEETYEQEDEEMLMRLIKVRKHLWT